MMDELGSRDEKDIVNILEQKIQGSDAYNQSEQARQRQDNINMYYLNPLGDEDENTSSMQSSDVFDAVEGTKAVMHEALTAGRELMHFEPESEEDVDLCNMADRYVRDRFKECGGYRFILDSLHDGLLAKNAICKYEWVEDSEEKIEQFVGMPYAQVEAILAQDNELEVGQIEVMDSVTPDGMVIPVASGYFIRTIDLSKFEFRLIKPEAFFGDESAETDDEFTFASDLEVLRKGELIEEYPHLEDEIRACPKFDEQSKEMDGIVRHGNDDSWRTSSQSEKAWERDPVDVYNCCIKLWGKQGFGTYHYRLLGRKTLLWEWPEGFEELPEDFNPADGELMDYMPYYTWSPYPLAHRWDGLAQADAVRDIQLTATNLKRSMINHALRTNNPMREANMEYVRNPEDLVDNLIGAVVDVESISNETVVKPIIQPAMDGSVFNTLAMVREDSGMRSSYTGLAGGLDGKALSNQNSVDLIAKMTDASNRRIMMMTRNFVELYLKKLYLSIYNMGVEYDKKTYQVQLNGNWVEMTPSQWPKRTRIDVVTAMTPEAALQSAMNKLQIHNVMLQLPERELLYSDRKQYNLISEVFKDIGETAIDRYIENPMSDEYKQAQMGILENQQKAQQAQAMAAKEAKEFQERQIRILELQAQQGQQKIDDEAAYNADKQSLAEDEFEHQKDKDEAEIILETRKIDEGKNVSGVSVGG